ncbi:hypothetical protein ES705_41513 [subsurface metagenome]
MRKRTKEFYEKMNRVMEELAKTDLSKRESKYAWALFRQTLGYGEYKDKISRFKMASSTGICETHISNTQKRLKERNIIKVNGKLKGFNLNTDEWEKVPLLVPFEKVPLLVQKGTATGNKKGTATGTLITNLLNKTPRREDFYMELSRKEIEGLDLENWYQAVMWNYGKFGMEYIEKTIKDYNYNTRMSCWYIYADSGNIRNKEAFFSHLLRNYQEEEKL